MTLRVRELIIVILAALLTVACTTNASDSPLTGPNVLPASKMPELRTSDKQAAERRPGRPAPGWRGYVPNLRKLRTLLCHVTLPNQRSSRDRRWA